MRKNIFTEEDVRALLIKHIDENFTGNRTAFARSIGYEVGNTVLDVVAGHKKPTPSILEALGFEKAVGYYKKPKE